MYIWKSMIVVLSGCDPSTSARDGGDGKPREKDRIKMGLRI